MKKKNVEISLKCYQFLYIYLACGRVSLFKESFAEFKIISPRVSKIFCIICGKSLVYPSGTRCRFVRKTATNIEANGRTKASVYYVIYLPKQVKVKNI